MREDGNAVVARTESVPLPFGTLCVYALFIRASRTGPGHDGVAVLPSVSPRPTYGPVPLLRRTLSRGRGTRTSGSRLFLRGGPHGQKVIRRQPVLQHLRQRSPD